MAVSVRLNMSPFQTFFCVDKSVLEQHANRQMNSENMLISYPVHNFCWKIKVKQNWGGKPVATRQINIKITLKQAHKHFVMKNYMLIHLLYNIRGPYKSTKNKQSYDVVSYSLCLQWLGVTLIAKTIQSYKDWWYDHNRKINHSKTVWHAVYRYSHKPTFSM